MARKVDEVTIDKEGRDFGKKFRITEMSAASAEWWATRLMISAMRSGADIPEDRLRQGMAGLAMTTMKIVGSIPQAEAKPLLDEMFACIKIMPDPRHPAVERPLLDDDIEEVSTRVFLRERTLSLHMGFSIAGELSRLRQDSPAPADESPSSAPTSQTP